MNILIIDDTSKTMAAIESNIENCNDHLYIESKTIEGARVVLKEMELDMVVLNMTSTSIDGVKFLLELNKKYKHLKVFYWNVSLDQKKGCDHLKKMLSK